MTEEKSWRLSTYYCLRCRQLLPERDLKLSKKGYVCKDGCEEAA